jgi:hypothetical protein
MSDKPQLPKRSDFPPGAEFVIKEFDVPLVRLPCEGWFNWFGGTPRAYDASSLRVDNSWSAESFEEWVAIVAASTAVEFGRQTE